MVRRFASRRTTTGLLRMRRLHVLCIFGIMRTLHDLHSSSLERHDRRLVSHVSGVPAQTEMIKQAQFISRTHGYVNLMFFNAAYLPFVKSWICNMHGIKFAGALRITLFVTLDVHASIELRAFEPGVNVYVLKTNSSNSALGYGTYAYFEVTLQRLQIQNQLIQAHVNVFVSEADAAWFSHTPFAYLQSVLPSVDIISADDAGDRLISAGFLLCRSTPAVRRFFQAYTNTYMKRLNELSSKDHDRIHEYDYGEQHLMTRLLRNSSLNVHWLSECEFCRGEWYSSKALQRKCPHPLVLQNNYIVGAEEKAIRAKRWGHWFLHESMQVCRPSRIDSTHLRSLHALYINRKTRTDRRLSIEHELARANISALRIEAEEVRSNDVAISHCWDGGSSKCAGQIGCQRSHINAIRFAQRQGWSHVAVFEDDFRWLSHFNPILLGEVLSKFNLEVPDWDVFGISLNILDSKPVPRVFLTVRGSRSMQVHRIMQALATHGYILRSHMFGVILQAFESCKVEADLLTAIDTCWQPSQLKYKWYGLKPQLGTQADGFSDIEGQDVKYRIA